MKEGFDPVEESETLDLGNVDTFVFDYGGVISHHYCEPWQSNLSKLLGADPTTVRKLLSESGELGRGYRLGQMTRDDFWESVIQAAGGRGADPSELEYNWAMTYQIDDRMMDLIQRLRSEAGAQVGILSNSDQYRQDHNERMYNLSDKFDFIISSHSHKVVKPDIEAYLKMLEVANRVETPSKVIYVDDRERNVTPGMSIGIKGYVFNRYEDFSGFLFKKGVLMQIDE